ncbi:MAG: hypothetical protein BWK72_18840 [Rhodoferax ferrireducens]|uniref:Uncharacterized protein n=1 Tax=Rhodoferax ferrireducens TaxID=192843 RepID=A0A1W9KPN7_9BURK|nr:MAG: hypothetical protein BWK72_18840 [Rhodoferax ferrireducens]
MTKTQPNPAEINEIVEVDTATPTNAELYQQAIEKGQAILKDEGSKAAAAREIYRMLQGEHRDVILKAFIDGATVTVKGAPTYFYNISRKFRKLAKAEPAKD